MIFIESLQDSSSIFPKLYNYIVLFSPQSKIFVAELVLKKYFINFGNSPILKSFIQFFVILPKGYISGIFSELKLNRLFNKWI